MPAGQLFAQHHPAETAEPGPNGKHPRVQEAHVHPQYTDRGIAPTRHHEGDAEKINRFQSRISGNIVLW